MINRAILQNPEIADNFDHFNDYKNTLTWLYHLPPTHQRDRAIQRLKTSHKLNQELCRNHDENELLAPHICAKWSWELAIDMFERGYCHSCYYTGRPESERSKYE
ncbi:MAG: hypothetical protein JRD89_02120 [Deltaproteobacteria bacterium]|nr:hypothetical protein [Deltaproteobacteria bacterium]